MPQVPYSTYLGSSLAMQLLNELNNSDVADILKKANYFLKISGKQGISLDDTVDTIPDTHRIEVFQRKLIPNIAKAKFISISNITGIQIDLNHPDAKNLIAEYNKSTLKFKIKPGESIHIEHPDITTRAIQTLIYEPYACVYYVHKLIRDVSREPGQHLDDYYKCLRKQAIDLMEVQC